MEIPLDSLRMIGMCCEPLIERERERITRKSGPFAREKK